MSNYEDARFALDEPHPLDLLTLTGATVRIEMSAVDTDPDRVVLFGEIDKGEWDAATRLGAFHTDLEPGAIPGEDSNVEVTLVLRSPVMDLYDDGEALLAAMFGAETTPLRHTESWLLASAMQSVEVPGGDGATSSSGYRTRWAPPLI